jgi:hypothetical protein
MVTANAAWSSQLPGGASDFMQAGAMASIHAAHIPMARRRERTRSDFDGTDKLTHPKEAMIAAL